MKTEILDNTLSGVISNSVFSAGCQEAKGEEAGDQGAGDEGAKGEEAGGQGAEGQEAEADDQEAEGQRVGDQGAGGQGAKGQGIKNNIGIKIIGRSPDFNNILIEASNYGIHAYEASECVDASAVKFGTGEFANETDIVQPGNFNCAETGDSRN